ncbi:AMP-binding protein [Streptomyces albofaciens]|uniref:AMP-binding protein n=1 Tax=Streptomyces albofaciens TaxID=66866 RepID=UPI001FCA81FE|nr:AMP-binding protein [Streptomyces albofaciens]
MIVRGRALPPVPRSPEGTTADSLGSLVYTSGSTGTPKGAMYTERLVRQFWVDFVPGQGVRPSIVLNYLPLSHMMGRGVLFGRLAKGGLACFAASGDLSTLFEDIPLFRPTEFVMVPRICDMLFQRYRSELARRNDAGTAGDAAEHAERVQEELRETVLGGRLLWAVSASAPLSAETTACVEKCLHVRLLNGYGSTEAGIVSLDGRVVSLPVTDHKLADVPELGYFQSDSSHPRGELLVTSDRLFSGYRLLIWPPPASTRRDGPAPKPAGRRRCRRCRPQGQEPQPPSREQLPRSQAASEPAGRGAAARRRDRTARMITTAGIRRSLTRTPPDHNPTDGG